MEQIQKQLEQAGYDYAVAIATRAEINAGAACGQLSLVTEGK
jgi:adenine C2-methylase RlmN of 23S rRNA A2503 and tRNA A37